MGAVVLRALLTLVTYPAWLCVRVGSRRRLHRRLQDGIVRRVERLVADGDELRFELRGGASVSLRPPAARAARWTVFEDRRGGFAQAEETWLLAWTGTDGARVEVLDTDAPAGSERPLERACAALQNHGTLGAPRRVDVSKVGLADIVLLTLWAGTFSAIVGMCVGSVAALPTPETPP